MRQRCLQRSLRDLLVKELLHISQAGLHRVDAGGLRASAAVHGPRGQRFAVGAGERRGEGRGEVAVTGSVPGSLGLKQRQQQLGRVFGGRAGTGATTENTPELLLTLLEAKASGNTACYGDFTAPFSSAFTSAYRKALTAWAVYCCTGTESSGVNSVETCLAYMQELFDEEIAQAAL